MDNLTFQEVINRHFRLQSNESTDIQNDSRYPRLGSTIANCRLSSIAGVGGVAVVYEAFEVDLELQRAIKVLKPETSDFLRKKFAAEAKITARLDHPNIVKIHGSGIHDGRLPFIDMEFVEGKTLRTLLDAHHTLPPAVCVAIVAIIASALEYAYGQSFSIWGNHTSKLVHRDLKPENILLSKDGVLKVMDFGLAQFEDSRPKGGWGTQPYMSPEQMDHKPADLRNDLYSLGVILYEMLCGARPFPDDELLHEQAKKKGDYQSIQKRNPSVPEAVCDIVDKCLQPDPEDRYRTYESLRSFSSKALAEITNRSPREVVKSFVVNPDNFHLLQHAIAESAKSEGKNKSIGWIAAVAGVALAGLAVVAFVLWPGRGEQPPVEPAAKESLTERQERQPNSHNAPSERTDFEPPVIRDRVAAKSPSEIVRVERTPSARPQSSIPEASPPSILARSVELLEASNYSGVIAHVNSLNLDSLPKPVRDSSVVLLANALYAGRSIPELVELGSRYSVNDARYLTVLAYAHEIYEDFHLAAEFMDKAVVAPFLLGGQPRASLLYDRAQFYKRCHEKIGDEASKSDMVAAYRRFVDEGCVRTSKNCEEARRILESHE